MHQFADRSTAGQILSRKMPDYCRAPNLLVVGLWRGGMPVGYEIARACGAELDTLLVRRLTVPGNPECTLGAITSSGMVVLNQEVVNREAISGARLNEMIRIQTTELQRIESRYRNGHSRPAIKGRPVMLVDDGIATGASMKAALRALRCSNPAQVVIAVPAAPHSVYEEFKEIADTFVSVILPVSFLAISNWYRNFDEVSDRKALHYLHGGLRNGANRSNTVPP